MGATDSGLCVPGTVLADKYIVEEQLGGGGMGVVIAARHKHLRQRVAIKLLKDGKIDDEARARFLREARAAVALQSEHVARVSDVGTLENGVPYMIMELLHGIDLETLVDEQGPLPIDDAVEYVLHACVAIAEAHTLGIVHRDLKPGNLFLTRRIDGTALVKVLDFGIAKALAEHLEPHPNLTTTGTALGTPSYMSPEQVRDAKTVDRRTDIWGLGSVLYQLLSGRPAFEADSVPSLCAKIIADPPEPLTVVRTDVSAALERIVEMCLEKDMKRRYQTVSAFSLALAEVAPERARELVPRILRIVDGRMSLAPDLIDWNPRDSLADTVAPPPPIDTITTGSLAVAALTARRDEPTEQPFRDTAGPWQTGPRPPHRRRALAAVVLCAAGGWLLWAAPWRSDEPHPPEKTAVEPASMAPAPSEAPAAEPQRPLVPSAAPSAAVSAAVSVAPPVRWPRAKPVAPSASAPPKPAPDVLLNDRK